MPVSKTFLKSRIDQKIRNKELPGTIEPGDVADLMFDLCDECMLEPIDVFLIAGQSNARGNSGPSGAANSPNPTPGTVFQFGNGQFFEVTDEVGDANTGSFAPSFAITWVQMTGRKICFVPRARNSTALYSAANTGEGYWGTGGTLYDDSIVNVDGALAKLIDLGYEPKFRGVLWSQGESDAVAINNSLMTKQNYKDELAILVGKYRTKYGLNMPFYIIKTGIRTGAAGPLTNIAGYQAIQEGQEEAVAADPLRVKFIYRSTAAFVDRGMMADVVHYNQAAYNEIGREGPKVILGGKDPI
jgi:hypothetical protein